MDFRKVMNSAAFICANLINQTEIARNTGISQLTVYRYLNLLEVTSIIKRIFPYFPARAKRIIKTPKVFFIDPALAVYLTGYSEEKVLQKAREKGTKIIAFEAKLTDSPSLRDVKNLLKFLEKFPEILRGVVIHTGEEIKWLHTKILALPWWYL